MAIVQFEDQGSFTGYDENVMWSKSHHYIFSGRIYSNDKVARACEVSGAYEITLPLTAKVGDTVYFVWVSYNTGDSLGEESGLMCSVGVYSTYEKAKSVKDAIRLNSESDEIEITVNDQVIYTGDWKGYFDSYNHCDIETLTVV